MPVASMPTTRGSDFAPLLKEVRARGLLERRNGYYARSIALNLILFGGVWAAVAFLGDSWWQLALAIPAAVFTARTSFSGTTRGTARSRAPAGSAGLLGLLHGNLLVGMSYGWWIDKHNRHHANPNHEDKDPDIAVGVVAFTPGRPPAGAASPAGWPATRPRCSSRCCCSRASTCTCRASRRPERQRRGRELALLIAHVRRLPGAAVLLVMSPVQGGGVHRRAPGRLRPLHGLLVRAQPQGHADARARRALDYLRRQVLTSRNVRGGRLTDWLLGGLNYQIEHHLFPNMPRANLPLAQSLVRSHCESLGVSYAEEGLVASYSRALRHLHEAGEPLRV